MSGMGMALSIINALGAGFQLVLFLITDNPLSAGLALFLALMSIASTQLRHATAEAS